MNERDTEMLRKLIPTLALFGLIAATACERPEEVELEDPVGEPTPIPGPTLAPPIPPDTAPRPDTLPVLDTL